MSTFRPLRDFIVVRPFQRSISETIVTPPCVGIERGRPNMDGRAIVLRVGPGRRNRRKGWYNPLEVVPGDLIAFEDHKAYPKDPTHPDLLIMQGADCVVIEGPRVDAVANFLSLPAELASHDFRT